MRVRQSSIASGRSEALPEDIGGLLFDLDPNAAGRVFSDDAATTAAAVDGKVAVIQDSVGGMAFRQTSDALRPYLKENASGKRWLERMGATAWMRSDIFAEADLLHLHPLNCTVVLWAEVATIPSAGCHLFGLYLTNSVNSVHNFQARDGGGTGDWFMRRYDAATGRSITNAWSGGGAANGQMVMLSQSYNVYPASGYGFLGYVNGARFGRVTNATAAEGVIRGVLFASNANTPGAIAEEGTKIFRVCIFDRPLTVGEIAALYQGTAGAWN